MGMDKVFFTPEWEGKVIHFPSLKSGSITYSACSWKLAKKLYERLDQFTEEWYEEEGLPSESEALFECALSGNEDIKALMLVYMQVPYAGSEFFSATDRQNQASESLTRVSENEFEALKSLHQQGCQSCPTLIAYKQGKQDESGFVPGGYVLYIVLDELPGVSLTKELFWGLSREERDAIRKAFKEAYCECLNMGIASFESNITKLHWSKSASRIYIARFQNAQMWTDKTKWSPYLWGAWYMAHPPGWWEVRQSRKQGDTQRIDEDGWIL